MNHLLNDIPSIPRIPSYEPLHQGITTRVMAKKQEERRNSLAESIKSDRRRSSKFLSGVSIPNSVIKQEIDSLDLEVKDSFTRRKERDEYVAQLLKRIQQKQNLPPSIYDETVDREALKRIKEELEKRSLVTLGTTEQRRRLRDAIKKMKESEEEKLSASSEHWEEIKEKRRISHRTSILKPLSANRRSTYESIRSAIQNSTVTKQLLDADNIEVQKIKQIQTGASILPSELKQNFSNMKKREASTSAIKLLKKEPSKTLGKDKRTSKRKLPPGVGERSSLIQRTSVEIKKIRRKTA